MSEATNMRQQAAPSAAMRALDRLVGRWNIAGGATGTVSYEHLDGNHFLIQHVALRQGGRTITGVEVLGHLRPFGGERSEHVHSRFYDNAGNTFDYVYQLDHDTLWIWAGEHGSPAHFRGVFEPDGNTIVGAWIYPGGGYTSTMTRVMDHLNHR